MTDYRSTGQYSGAAGTTFDSSSSAATSSPSPPNLITPGAGGTITYEANTAGAGTKAIRVAPAAATAGFWGWTAMTTDPSNPNKITLRGFWTAPSSIPATGVGILRFASSGGGTNLADIGIAGTTGFFTVTNLGTGPGTNSGSFGAVAGTTYDIEVGLENPTITTGTCTVTVRSTAGATLSTVTRSAVDFGTAAPATVRMGKPSSTGTLGATDWKFVTVRTGASSGLGAPGANTAPTVPAIASQVQGVGSTSFTASPTDAEGDTLTHAWTVTKPDGTALTTGITGASTATVTIANQATAGTYVVIDTVSDGISPTIATTYLLVAKASGVAALPDRVVSNPGSWGPAGDAATIIAGARDQDGSGWFISPDAPAGNTITFHWEAPGPGHHVFSEEIAWFDSVTDALVSGQTGTITARVYQGVTPITDEKIFTNGTNAWVAVSFGFTTGEDATLAADLTDIRVEMKATQ